jgi:hypothetical protein
MLLIQILKESLLAGSNTEVMRRNRLSLGEESFEYNENTGNDHKFEQWIRRRVGSYDHNYGFAWTLPHC